MAVFRRCTSAGRSMTIGGVCIAALADSLLAICHILRFMCLHCSVRHNQDTFNKLGWYSLLLVVAGIGSFFLFGRGPVAGVLLIDGS